MKDHLNSMQVSQRSAFSLVELSIVLVILGLLTGGILAGQSLIRAAELRATTRNLEQYATATNQFRDKYFALPGDFATAHSFWGATCATLAANCNGNGDGTLDDPSHKERLLFWQHLSLAGLVEGGYAGNANGSVTSFIQIAAGVHVPRTPISSGSYIADPLNAFSGTAITPPAYYNNFVSQNRTILISTASNAAMGSNMAYGGSIVSPDEAWNIDTKRDDGLPTTGKAVAFEGFGSSAGTCVSGTAYALNQTSKSCLMSFAIQ